MKRAAFLFSYLLLSVACAESGTMDAVYIHEGFNGASLPAGWTQLRLSGTQAGWSVIAQGSNPTVNPYAGTGQAKFNSFDAAQGEQARLVSASINLTAAIDPFLSVFMYHDDEYPGSLDSIYVEASTADSVSGPWTILAGVQRPRADNRWIRELLSLYQYRGVNRIFLSLRGVSKFGNNIFLDEFRIADSTFHDLGPAGVLYNTPSQHSFIPIASNTTSRITAGKKNSVGLSGPEPLTANADAPLNIGIAIRNYGTFTENSYTVAWRIDGQQQTSFNGHPIDARTGRDTVTLTWQNPVAGVHDVLAWSVLASDSNRINDTIRFTIQVLDTSTVFYESFNGTSFPPLNWVTMNRDGGQLAPWFRGADTSAFVSFEGAGFAANNFQRSNNFYLDDYLISPPISGVGQSGRVDSLIFWVRSKFNSPPSPNFPDSLMVLLSTTGTDTSGFTTTLEYFDVPKAGWARKAYLLSGRVPPNSTVWIAFRYLLYNSGFNGSSGDFVGIDAVQVIRPLPLGVDDELEGPTSFSLHQNYPNPFNPTTTIQFSVGTYGHASLRVFDLLGRELETLVDERLAPGVHSVSWTADAAASGVYFYRLSAGNFVETKKMLLIR